MTQTSDNKAIEEYIKAAKRRLSTIETLVTAKGNDPIMNCVAKDQVKLIEWLNDLLSYRKEGQILDRLSRFQDANQISKLISEAMDQRKITLQNDRYFSFNVLAYKGESGNMTLIRADIKEEDIGTL